MTQPPTPTTPKFIQVHFLAAWPGALLNRDDAGLAKRLPFGAATRTRISSQCLKRHWRMADDPHALHALAKESGVEGQRSKVAIERQVTGPLRDRFPAELVQAVEDVFIKKFYGDKAKDTKSRQALLFGRPELDYLRTAADSILAEGGDAKAVAARAEAWTKQERANLAQLREQNALAPSLEAALFGRMMTSDPRANTDAAIHVAHAFTVHAEQPELDYFTVVDDLRRDDGEAGAAGVFDTELTSGLYYGYVVVDVPLLVSNLTGCRRADWAGDADRDLAARVVEHLLWLVAEVSPGAKKGSTAPYSRAELVLVEAGDRQPRTLANAFRDPVPLDPTRNESLGRLTADRMAGLLADMDSMYATGEGTPPGRPAQPAAAVHPERQPARAGRLGGRFGAPGRPAVTRHLLLRLDAPLMSFGAEAVDAYGVVRDFPARSRHHRPGRQRPGLGPDRRRAAGPLAAAPGDGGGAVPRRPAGARLPDGAARRERPGLDHTWPAGGPRGWRGHVRVPPYPLPRRRRRRAAAGGAAPAAGR